jgi:hypothetical protein
MIQVRFPSPVPSEVAIAADTVSEHLSTVLANNRRKSRPPLRKCDLQRILAALRVMQALGEGRDWSKQQPE